MKIKSQNPVLKALLKDENGFAKALLNWFENNQRDLPWRKTIDPYKVWLSEIILQQTRVDQGMSYYLVFCSRYPTIIHLAHAIEDDVLHTWQGLGYYTRARNLHFTARYIANELGGKFPTTYNELLKLKGVGEYTAAAIASFCFGEKVAVVDGNVARVLSRIFGIEKPIDSTHGKKELREFANQLISKRYPGTFNQAIMEFGATWCAPRNPKCNECPFAKVCVAQLSGRVSEFPFKKKKRQPKTLHLFYFILREGNRTYISKRTGSGIWRGLFEFPLFEYESKTTALRALKDFSKKFPSFKIHSVGSVSDQVTHLLSHRKLIARFIHIEGKMNPSAEEGNLEKTSWKKIRGFAMPRLITRYLENYLGT